MGQISFNLSKIRSKEEIAAFKKFTEVKKEVQEMGETLKGIDELPADLARGQKGQVIVDKVDFNQISYTGSMSYDVDGGNLKNLNMFGSAHHFKHDKFAERDVVGSEERNVFFTDEADRETYEIKQMTGGDTYVGDGQYEYLTREYNTTFVVNKSNGTITYTW